jgi:hypothetical protein
MKEVALLADKRSLFWMADTMEAFSGSRYVCDFSEVPEQEQRGSAYRIRMRMSETRNKEALRWEAEMKEQQMLTNFNSRSSFPL